MIIREENYLEHYGTPRHSGRYPWGSGGEDTNTRNKSFLDHVADMKRQGLSEPQIAQGLGMKTVQFRARKSAAINEQKQSRINQAVRLKEAGNSNVAIGKEMGINESSVRSLLAPDAKRKADILISTQSMLQDEIEKHKYIDVGAGVELHMGVSKDKLKVAVVALEDQGYKRHYVKINQLGTGNETTQVVLTKGDVPYKEVYANRADVRIPGSFSLDGGENYITPTPPMSISSKRVGVRYKEEGGGDADGIIYVRPNVADVSLGGAHYAQVRVSVDKTHYLKGMAMYKDDLPEGVDLVFNTVKSNTGNKLDAFKPFKEGDKFDVDLPFGAVTRPLTDQKGKTVSVMNIVNEEGDWSEWSRSLSSQFLSKQSPKLAQSQLNMTFDRRKDQLAEINAMTNPAVRKKLLEEFASGTDAAATHLKAAALPSQGSHVILPVPSMKQTEVYAPNYTPGQRVVLIRYPHGGVFEIPELTVNNRNPEAKKLLGKAPDAIGIHPDVAKRLSGADFDGDTVLVIPNHKGNVRTSPALLGLKDFDPQSAYPGYEGMQKMKVENKQSEMGKISNLITDMTIKGANQTEIAQAVRHSMVVIDAEKHGLNYRQSYLDNNIKLLKEKYQLTPEGNSGASTIVSRAKARVDIPQQKLRLAGEGGPVDRATGKLVFVPTGNSFIGKDGKLVIKTTKAKKLDIADDARSLSSGTVIEEIYAKHSNKLKALANQARLDALSTPNVKRSPSAAVTYKNEVTQLNSALALALRNAPLERQAQVIANSVVSAKKAAHPEMEKDQLKKVKNKALSDARERVGAGKTRIVITQAQWNAIQAGAISNDKLKKILDNADLDSVKELALPKSAKLMTSSKTTRARLMVEQGYPQGEIAAALGVSLTTLKTALS